ncbi:Inorganic pyrophosphatase [uncultured archaeon]|nr:Inorganic pyrophosphatase [uncultured archaeon]
MALKDTLPPGRKPPHDVYAVIEVSQGSRVKYEVDSSDTVFVNRILFTSMFYPFNYGFIPQTLDDDGDPLDILVMGYEPLVPKAVIPCKPVGVLIMEDEEGVDNKILAVPAAEVDSRFAGAKEIKDLPPHTKEEISHFFMRYKELEPGKWVDVKKWGLAADARKEVLRSIEAYKKQAKKKKQ